MARPLYRDVFAWVFSVPTAAALLLCLGLPQVQDCRGHVQTASEAGTRPFILLLAHVALVPVAWHVLPFARRALTAFVVTLAGIAVLSNLLAIPIAIYCVARRPWRNAEHLTAFCCACCGLAFVVMFPLLTLFATWLPGAGWAWAGGWGVLVAGMLWSSAARERSWEQEARAISLIAAPETPGERFPDAAVSHRQPTQRDAAVSDVAAVAVESH